jgi:hypothetical protein
MHLMRKLYIMLGMAILVMLFYYMRFSSAQAATLQNSNLTNAINSTASFINRVNQSSYLVFYPDLKPAYSYLDRAKIDANNGNYSDAYLLLANARASAQAQLDRINSYRSVSFYALTAIAIALAVLLYALMLPKKHTSKHQQGRKS